MRLNHRQTIPPPPDICVIGYGVRGWRGGVLGSEIRYDLDQVCNNDFPAIFETLIRTPYVRLSLV